MRRARPFPFLELALVVLAVSLYTVWTLRGPGKPEPTPTPSASPHYRLAGISLEQDEATVCKVLGEPGSQGRVGSFRSLEYGTPGQGPMTVVLLDEQGRVMSIMAEQHALSDAGQVLIQPGDAAASVEKVFGPPSQRGAGHLTWRQFPRQPGQELPFGELTVHLVEGRVSQVVLVKNLLP